MEISTEYPKPRLVVLIGHSFITRLGVFINNEQEFENLRLYKGEFKVMTRSRCNVSTHELVYERELDFQDVHTEGGICFIQVGGNDLTNPQATPNSVARQIMALAQALLLTNNFSFVIIGQLLRRHPSKVGSKYNCKVIDTNILLHNLCQESTSNLIFWHHRGFWDPDMKYLASDGVHLKDSSHDHRFMKRYLQSIKAAVLNASHLPGKKKNKEK